MRPREVPDLIKATQLTLLLLDGGERNPFQLSQESWAVWAAGLLTGEEGEGKAAGPDVQEDMRAQAGALMCVEPTLSSCGFAFPGHNSWSPLTGPASPLERSKDGKIFR